MMDADNHIFEPDIVLSSELLGRSQGPPSPERALMLAVLEDAMRCFLNSCMATEGKRRTLYEETRDWLRSTEHTRLYDFDNICNVLGIDADYLRRRLFAQRDRVRAAARAATASAKTDRDPDAPEPLRAAG